MAFILNLESATNVCSVSVAEEGITLAYREEHDGPSHARLLTGFIDECLKEAGIKYHHLDAIAVSKGPGSYTGLRIGVATAKGLCYALDKPLISVNTLLSMTSFLKLNRSFHENHLFCPMIDARRMEVYTAVIDKELKFEHETSALIIDNQLFSQFASNSKLFIFGDGSGKAKSILTNRDHYEFIDDFYPSARGMSKLSYKSYIENSFESVAYFEPFYLKDFYHPGQLL